MADEALDEVERWFGTQGDLRERFGRCFRTAIDQMIDCKSTGRYSLDQLNTQEKIFVGVRVETVVRGEFALPSHVGHNKDYVIEGHEVDCKWSISFGGWTIPPEQVGHLALLLHANDRTNEMAVGLARTIEDVLNPGTNRDGKRTINAAARTDAIRWLVERGPGLPPNFLLHLDAEDREAILSKRGGVDRAFELYTRCEGVVISRETMAAVAQQTDDARRMRGGEGGVRPLLLAAGFELLNGTRIEQRDRAEALGGPRLRSGETICLRVDGTTPARLAAKAGRAP